MQLAFEIPTTPLLQVAVALPVTDPVESTTASELPPAPPEYVALQLLPPTAQFTVWAAQVELVASVHELLAIVTCPVLHVRLAEPVAGPVVSFTVRLLPLLNDEYVPEQVALPWVHETEPDGQV